MTAEIPSLPAVTAQLSVIYITNSSAFLWCTYSFLDALDFLFDASNLSLMHILLHWCIFYNTFPGTSSFFDAQTHSFLHILILWCTYSLSDAHTHSLMCILIFWCTYSFSDAHTPSSIHILILWCTYSFFDSSTFLMHYIILNFWCHSSHLIEYDDAQILLCTTLNSFDQSPNTIEEI